MTRWIAAYLFILVAVTPALAFANPNTESPEPSFWLFVLMGAVPLAVVAWRQVRLKAVAAESHQG